jgi:hypothetical protein
VVDPIVVVVVVVVVEVVEVVEVVVVDVVVPTASAEGGDGEFPITKTVVNRARTATLAAGYVTRRCIESSKVWPQLTTSH